MMAIENGHVSAVTFLTERGADVTRTDECGYKALHYACINNSSPEVFSCLLEKGADINACLNNGMTPLLSASLLLSSLNKELMWIFKTTMVKQLFIMH